jgi:hypothetical protein
MSETVAIHPLHGRRLPSRVLVTLAVAVLIATAFAVILLVAAVRDSGESRPNSVPAAVPPPAGADFSQDTCEPARVYTAC